jgi:hypothetical protein
MRARRRFRFSARSWVAFSGKIFYANPSFPPAKWRTLAATPREPGEAHVQAGLRARLRRGAVVADNPESKVLLTLENGAIVAKEYTWVSNGIMGIAALCEDGTCRLFAVDENPTYGQFYGIGAGLTYEERRESQSSTRRAGLKRNGRGPRRTKTATSFQARTLRNGSWLG